MRPIDADEALRMMQNSRQDNPCSSASHASVWWSAHDCCISCVDALPTLDVVPREEVDRLRHMLDSYAIQYGTVKDQHAVIDRIKAETAREIFEEIEKALDVLDHRHMLCGNPKQSWGVRSAMTEIAEIKKKYTED